MLLNKLLTSKETKNLSFALTCFRFSTNVNVSFVQNSFRNNAVHKRIRERNNFFKEIRNIETTIRSNLTQWIGLLSKNYFFVTQK